MINRSAGFATSRVLFADPQLDWPPFVALQPGF